MSSLTAERSASAGGLILVMRFAASSVLNYTFGVALAWLLVPADFGAVSALQNVLLLAAGVLTAGLPWALAVKIASRSGQPETDARDFRTAVVGNLGLGLLLAVAFLTLELSGMTIIPSAGPALVVIVACTIPVLGLNAVMAGALQGSRRFGGLGAMLSVEVLTKCLVATLLVASLHAGAEGVALGFLVGSVSATVTGIRSLRGILPTPGPLARLRSFKMAIPIWVGTASFTFLLTSDVLALGLIGRDHGVTAEVIAGYQVCAILARAPYYATDALIDAVFPFMARRSESRSGSHRSFLSAVRWVPLAIVPIQLVLLLAPSVALRLLFPKAYSDLGSVLQLMTIGTLGLLLTNMLVKGLYALKCSAAVGIRMPWPVVIELAALMALVPRYGAAGAASAYCVAGWLGVVLLTPVYIRRQRIPWPGWSIGGRYLLAIVPVALLLIVGARAPGPMAWSAIVFALALFVLLARATRLLADKEAQAVARMLTTLRPRRRPRGVPADSGNGVQPAEEGGSSVLESVIAPLPELKLVVSGRARSRRLNRWRLLVVGCVSVGALATLSNVFSSPDTVYDEVAYTQAAHNIANSWSLTWTNQPMFVHPPIYFLLQAGWLRVTGQAMAPLPDSIHTARILTATFEVANVALIATLTYLLAEHAGITRRHILAAFAAVFAALDPVLVRYSRLAIIEPVALCLSLLALLLTWKLRKRSALLHVAAVGLATGFALLTKEITAFLLVSPVIFAVLERNRNLLWRALGALGVGLMFWLLFPLWSLELGLGSSFLDSQSATFQRLLGLVQITGWNRPGVSAQDAVLRSASHYLASYLTLAVAAGAMCWMWWRRNSSSGNFVTAWLTMSLVFGAYTVVAGTLNEQFFVYVLPGGMVASIIMVDAALARTARPTGKWSWPRVRLRRYAVAIVTGILGAGVFAASTVSWAQQYVGDNAGVTRLTQAISTDLPSCSVVNGSGDSEKFSYLLKGRRVASYAQGAAALSHGIHFFILAPNDALARYGNMSPALRSWIRGHGTRVASFASKTYQGVQLWQVASSDYDGLSDQQYIPGGVYVNTVGSRCGGFTVTDGAAGNFFDGYQSRGGKAMLGKPMTQVAKVGGGQLQIFQGIVLSSSSAGPTRQRISTLPVVAELADMSPVLYRNYGLPEVATHQPVTWRDWLTDPQITRAFLGGAAPTSQSYAAAEDHFGRPLGPATRRADGSVAQAFAGVVLERPVRGVRVRTAPIGVISLSAGLLTLPPEALRNQDAPPLPDTGGPAQPTSVLPFVRGLAGTMVAFFAGVTFLSRRRRTQLVKTRTRERAA